MTRCQIASSPSGPGPLRRLIESYDLSRRSFHHYATIAGGNRDIIAESCDLAGRQLAETMAEQCGSDAQP
jgi:hypothetical protein